MEEKKIIYNINIQSIIICGDISESQKEELKQIIFALIDEAKEEATVKTPHPHI